MPLPISSLFNTSTKTKKLCLLISLLTPLSPPFLLVFGYILRFKVIFIFRKIICNFFFMDSLKKNRYQNRKFIRIRKRIPRRSKRKQEKKQLFHFIRVFRTCLEWRYHFSFLISSFLLVPTHPHLFPPFRSRYPPCPRNKTHACRSLPCRKNFLKKIFSTKKYF